MTNQLFFDTDCLAAFLWTGNESLVAKLYPGRIVIPQMVYDELSRVCDLVFLERVNSLIDTGQAELWDIELSSEAFPLYRNMTTGENGTRKLIGKGEASALSLAHCHKGIVASNNFKDTSSYIRELDLDYTTTGDILIEAYESAYITENEGNAIWAEMLAANRWIGASSFSEYLKKPYKPLNHY